MSLPDVKLPPQINKYYYYISYEVDDGPRGRGAQSEHQPGPHPATVRGRATEEPQQTGLRATRDAHGQEAGGEAVTKLLYPIIHYTLFCIFFYAPSVFLCHQIRGHIVVDDHYHMFGGTEINYYKLINWFILFFTHNALKVMLVVLEHFVQCKYYRKC